ncbi:MAG: hypothetical protein E7019_01890 [Alphaproteobacteria bacterium]|nr:hypothetical protein [Alphaproteobacteria bacterium]
MQDNAFIDKAWYKQLLTDVTKSVLVQNLGVKYSRLDYIARIQRNYDVVVNLFKALKGKKGEYNQNFFIARYRRLENMENKLSSVPFYRFKYRKKIRKDIVLLNQIRVNNLLLFLRDSFIEANLGTEEEFFFLANEVAEKLFLRI